MGGDVMVVKWLKDVPFPRHRYVYIGLKVAVIAIATYLALRFFAVI
jgi:hypothetical protein